MPLVSPLNPETPQGEGPQEGDQSGFKNEQMFSEAVADLVQAFAVLMVTGMASGSQPKNLDQEETIDQMQQVLMKRIVAAANKMADAFNPDAMDSNPKQDAEPV